MRSLAINQFCTLAQILGFVNLALSEKASDFDWNRNLNTDQESARLGLLLPAVRRFGPSAGAKRVI
jgi:hypothetical protein